MTVNSFYEKQSQYTGQSIQQVKERLDYCYGESDATSSKPEGAVKYDAGKPTLLKGGLGYFPEAISMVSSVSHFGATKYAWDGWRHVDNGFDRYSEAMVRHLVEEGAADILDADSRLPHIGHTAWNALARLELWLVEEKKKTDGRDQ